LAFTAAVFLKAPSVGYGETDGPQSLDKTLATIGEGSVSVNGKETSPDGVNRLW